MKRTIRVGAALGATLATAVAFTIPAGSAGASGADGAARGKAFTQSIAQAQSRADQDRQSLGLTSDEKLIVRDVVTDPNGTTHTRYDRTFKGLRVIGGDFILERDAAGRTKDTNWNASGKVAVASTTPKVAKSTALAASKNQTAKSDTTATAQRGELVVFAGGATPRLAWDTLTEGTRANGAESRRHTYVDAQTGAVITSREEVVEGTGNSMFNGKVTINTTQANGTWQLKDSHGNSTSDMKGGTSGSGTLYTDADNLWGNGSNSDRATAGVDAQFGAEKTFDYYNTQQGRAGIWGDGRGAPSRVHYGVGYANANWNGSMMTYGDGNDNNSPLTELDVAAHEMTHGVTEKTANLDYGDPDHFIFVESGGLNEATSDIFGTAVEFYVNSAADPGDYLMGEKIDLNGDGTPLRYMDKPSKDGYSMDCYSARAGQIDPHLSSGPLNHWFYLASEGSGAKTINGVAYNSPTCNSSTVTGAGRTNIEKVWYRALSTKLTTNSNYAAAREAGIKSAIELFGGTSQTCKSVEAAFSAISVPAGAAKCDGSTPTEPPPTGGNLLLNPGFESGAVNWTGTSGPITNNTGRPARTGSWKMWLGGNGSSSTETESQTVTIPATATAPKLSFYVRIDTSETGTTAYDTMKPQIVAGGTTTTLATFSNATTTGGAYALKTYDLSAYKGQTITVKFLASEDSSSQTSFVIDDTAVTTS